jgi:hypothetical protein
MHSLQPLMAEHGLTIVQHQKSLDFIQDGAALAIQYEFSVLHTSGDKLDFAPIHTGVAAAKTSKGSPDDKAANKCHTAARKYFLLSLFQIPTGDYADPDADGDVPQTGKKTTEAKGSPKPAEQPREPAPQPFAMITPDGEEVTFERGGDYLKAIETEFKGAPDKLGFWDTNKDHFIGWHTELIQKSANSPKAKAAADEFGRVGKMVMDELAPRSDKAA